LHSDTTMSSRKRYQRQGIFGRVSYRFRSHPFRSIGLVIGGLLLIWLSTVAVNLKIAAAKPIDGYFVLGGSIKREMYVAELSKQTPELPVLISQGSADPCILLIFQRAQASLNSVWLEKCADSTFSNFFFGLPILRQWGVHRVKLITSDTHLPRALWMAQILLGAHGIWVEPAIAPEEGVPANQESWLKTGLDVSRSLLWAVISQVYQPHCQEMTRLADVNLQDWQKWQRQGFQCEHQGNLDL
jgi:uncharacterized SAM-binding protein YcdF (DUF218 family)